MFSAPGVLPRVERSGGRVRWRSKSTLARRRSCASAHDWAAVMIAATTLILILRWKVKEPILVGLAAAAGIALHWPF
jgi:hypothetical protein